MRVGLLQFSPSVGAFAQNVAKARALLHNRGPLDLLVLPEMAFSGYLFRSKDHIRPHLEPLKGPSFDAACELARTGPCKMVMLGFPEISEDGNNAYNAGMVVKDDQILYSFRKKHLYQVDESWATEGSDFGLFETESLSKTGQTTKIALGICMDLNPLKFQAPFDAYEFGHHCAKADVDVIIVPMAWTKSEPTAGHEDDLASLRYWLMRLSPVLDSHRRTLFIACDRTGREDETSYQGSSCVISIDHGKLTVLGKLGLEEGLLVVDVPLEDE